MKVKLENWNKFQSNLKDVIYFLAFDLTAKEHIVPKIYK